MSRKIPQKTQKYDNVKYRHVTCHKKSSPNSVVRIECVPGTVKTGSYA